MQRYCLSNKLVAPDRRDSVLRYHFSGRAQLGSLSQGGFLRPTFFEVRCHAGQMSHGYTRICELVGRLLINESRPARAEVWSTYTAFVHPAAKAAAANLRRSAFSTARRFDDAMA